MILRRNLLDQTDVMLQHLQLTIQLDDLADPRVSRVVIALEKMACRDVVVVFALTTLAVTLIGQLVGAPLLVLAASVFFAGLLMNAAQTSMQALAAAYYPTAGRATGVAWTLGIGRFGGIAGSFLVAELARRHLPLPEVFMLVGVPGLIAAAALLIKDRYSPDAGKPVFLEPTGAH